MKRYTGQTLTEYGIVLSLILVAAIPAVYLCRDSIQDLLQKTAQMDEKKTPLSLLEKQAVSITSPIPTEGSSAPQENVLPEQDKVVKDVNAPSAVSPADFSTNLTSTVATLGANGATFELSNQLKTLAEKLNSSGEITEAEANKIVALANQGYRLAELEKLVEENSKNTRSTQAFLQSRINFDGKNYSMNEVAGLIGFGTPTDLTQDIQKNANYMLETANASPETMAFIVRYNDAMSGSNIQNSEAKHIISQLSSQISYLTDATSNLIYGAEDPRITLENLRNNTVSQATVYDSRAICYVGSGNCSR